MMETCSGFKILGSFSIATTVPGVCVLGLGVGRGGGGGGGGGLIILLHNKVCFHPFQLESTLKYTTILCPQIELFTHL